MIEKSLTDSFIVTVLILKSHPKPCLRQDFVHLSVLSSVGKLLATSESLSYRILALRLDRVLPNFPESRFV